jgi:hypothetical protein
VAFVLCGLWLVHASCATETSAARPKLDGGSVDSGVGSTGGSSGTGAGWPGGTGGSSQGGSAGSAQGGTAGTSSGASAGVASGGCPSGGVAGSIACGAGGPCEFPQGVPDNEFIATACKYEDTDPSVDAAVNTVMASLTGCGIGSDCPITIFPTTEVNTICQSWFAAVAAELRAQGYCAGQHAFGSTDEIAVSNTCCEGKWYGYHICNYGGAKVVWNPGARRGWWMINPTYCGP